MQPPWMLVGAPCTGKSPQAPVSHYTTPSCE